MANASAVSGKEGGTSPGAAGQASAGAGGAGQGSGRPGSYVQLKPHGDTQILDHRAPDIGYQPTRFEQDWTPKGESSIDTALRHAVEKTTVRHTFHLPRGVRIECVVVPLLPMALIGCGNADPPARPLADQAYRSMHLGSANPLVPPAAASAASAPVAAIKLDNSVACANARVAGGPPPPGCPPATIERRPPAASAGSWVPASDQF
jgi:hypothetical protein